MSPRRAPTLITHAPTRDAIANTGRKTLLVAGVATEIVVQRSALSGPGSGLRGAGRDRRLPWPLPAHRGRCSSPPHACRRGADLDRLRRRPAGARLHAGDRERSNQNSPRDGVRLMAPLTWRSTHRRGGPSLPEFREDDLEAGLVSVAREHGGEDVAIVLGDGQVAGRLQCLCPQPRAARAANDLRGQPRRSAGREPGPALTRHHRQARQEGSLRRLRRRGAAGGALTADLGTAPAPRR